MRAWSRWTRPTAKLCQDFGKGGEVDLVAGLRNKQSYGDEYEQTSPPAVIGDLIVVGSAIADNNSTVGATGEVRAFDARTRRAALDLESRAAGSRRSGVRDLAGAAGIRSGGANTWSIIAADPKRDLVFLPTTSPAVDYYGVTRLGDNRYANSVVALRASTGKLVWHFQTVHHDLWDYDNASPPALITLPDGKDAVLQGTKTAQLFVLDRETGAPLFPVEERAVPKSDIAGEETSPTQPVSALVRGLSHTHRQRHLGRDARGSGRMPRALRDAALRRAVHAALRARLGHVAGQHRRCALGRRCLRHRPRHRHRA